MVHRNGLIEYFSRERQRLVGYVRKWFGSRDSLEPEDLVQDVFINLLERAVHPIENLGAYVYRALDNRMTDQFRKKSRETLSFEEIEDTLGGHALDRILEDFRVNTSRDLERRELNRRLFAAVDQLPADQRAVLIATEIEGFTFEELAEDWDEPLGTLLSRKHRAVKALREQLKKYF